MRSKLRYYSALYISEGITGKKLGRIKNMLEKKPLRAGVYLITAAPNPHDQLEVFSSGLLAQQYYQNNPPYIIGITQNYEEAIHIVEQIVRDCLEERGDCGLKEYLT